VWGRQLTTESEIIEALKEAGYKIFLYHPGQHSFEEQIKTFRKFRIFIGPHGGALTNIIWPEEACLIELFGEKVVNRSYEAVCQILSFDYHRITGESKDLFWKGNRKDYIIDPAKVIEVLESLKVEDKL
jgi:capsular polysaccharide biosynthesis protein